MPKTVSTMTTRAPPYTRQPTIFMATDSTVPKVFATTGQQPRVAATVTIKTEADDFLDNQIEQTDLGTTSFRTNRALDFKTFNTTLSISQNMPVKSEPLEFVDSIPTTEATMTINTLTSTTQPATILATTNTLETQTDTTVSQVIATTVVTQPTATQSVAIKTEPQEFTDSQMGQTGTSDHLTMLPDPPNWVSRDSEGGLSSQCSSPSCPISRYSSWKPYTQPFYKTPIPDPGMLILTKEEKRALITGGYPIPTKLPLTKQEERCLMKIRRKIKNKISAQESRRKKKEYLGALEKRVETLWQENDELKKRVDFLEATNRTLHSQLKKNQSLAGKISFEGTRAWQ